MASSTRCLRNGWLDKALRAFLIVLLALITTQVRAQSSTEVTQFLVERVDDEVLVSAQVLFELPAAVEDALLKGIPMFFVAEADVLRERWYWYDKKATSAERHFRLAYQPLTRRWRLGVTNGSGREPNQGLALNPVFDTLGDALTALKKISRWKIADTADLDSGHKYKVELRFRLDLSQLPRPFQIGTLGQSDWDLAATANAVLSVTPSK